MANVSKRLPENVPGDFFVDSSCIDCDQCRQITPSVFRAYSDKSVVHHQPETPEEALRAEMALLACPTASIGTVEKRDLTRAIASFPEWIAETIYFCGFTSEDSYGASSYLIVRPEGNVLVDSPRFTTPLVRRMEAMGGVSLMFLTHGDDVADHEEFRKHFGCERLMHRGDIGPSTASVERKLEGPEALQVSADLLVIPTPGHTRGHQVLLYQEKILFTGDHLWWNEARKGLSASKEVCWYSWEEQIRSMERLLAFRFEWVLPGHGHRHHASVEEMHHSLEQCIAWMKRQ
ncbi:MAG: MBL fold metallo-hydrolase [Candidatus Omnitrophica bacterium]|nr:MBL fold metallo-hydrolase [Candidatus Omnitrophota bacterium]